MLKKTVFSPAQPQRAKTRLVPGKAAGESQLEAYPLGRTARQIRNQQVAVEDFDELRMTHKEQRVSAR
jgi:hypothetical protein